MPGWGTLRGWRRCAACRVLWFGPEEASSARSRCSSAGRHSATRSANYSLVHRDESPGDCGVDQFRRCDQCQGLFFGPGADASACPDGGLHRFTDSPSFVLADGGGPGPSGWRVCTRCQGLCLDGDASDSECPGGGIHAPAGDRDFHIPEITRRLRVHTKTIVPSSIPVGTMFQGMRDVYGSCGVDVEWVSDEMLDDPDLQDLDVVEVGRCNVAGAVTEDQIRLFDQRRGVSDDDVVVYFVRATDRPTSGCSKRPVGRNVAIVTAIASQWTMAHEIGHVLGLAHVKDSPDRLMTDGGTALLTNPPPDLDDEEAAAIAAQQIVAAL